MRTNEVSNSADILDSRDIIKRLEELEDERDSYQEENMLPDIDLTEEYIDEKYTGDFLGLSDEEIKAKIEGWSVCWEYYDEYKALKEFADEIEGYALDWRYGATLIRESYWVQYCKELVNEVGDIPGNLPSYIENNIDWQGVADDLSVDYTEAEFDGVTALRDNRGRFI